MRGLRCSRHIECAHGWKSYEHRSLHPAAVGCADGLRRDARFSRAPSCAGEHSVPFGPAGVCGPHRQLLAEGSAVGSGLAGEAWRCARHFRSSSNTRVRCPARPPPTVCCKARSFEGCGGMVECPPFRVLRHQAPRKHVQAWEDGEVPVQEVEALDEVAAGTLASSLEASRNHCHALVMKSHPFFYVYLGLGIFFCPCVRNSSSRARSSWTGLRRTSHILWQRVCDKGSAQRHADVGRLASNVGGAYITATPPRGRSPPDRSGGDLLGTGRRGPGADER